jgi:hypothetical protein
MLLVWEKNKFAVLNNNVNNFLNSNLGVGAGWGGVRQVVLTFETCLKYEIFNFFSEFTHVIDKVVT